MADFNIRSESVDVEQIMAQIRARIREKRGVDYTEDQIRELATVRLEKFLDPKNLRSDLLEQFRRSRPAIPADPSPIDPPYAFDDQTLVASHRGSLRFIRKLLNPILKLFFNPNTLNQILYAQSQFNADLLKREQRRKIEFEQSRSEWNALYYEVLHNLVLETTRNGIELKNMKMRLEALASRLDFSERRVRALEGVVQYRPEAVRRDRDRTRERPTRHEPDTEVLDTEARGASAQASEMLVPSGGPGGAGIPADVAGRRRRRRRRGRRGAGLAPAATVTTAGGPSTSEEIPAAPDDGFDEGDDMEVGPFDADQDKPLDSARGEHFDSARGEPLDSPRDESGHEDAHETPSDPEQQ